MLVVGIGGGGERDKNISEREFVGKSACSADTDQVLYAVFGRTLSLMGETTQCMIG